MPVDLPILIPAAEPAYFCPGESRPITRAIHEARIAARWPLCETCASRPGSLKPVRWSSLSAVIRRTRWGVRGPWQNAMTRLRAAQLTEIFTSHLIRQRDAVAAEHRGDPGEVEPRPDSARRLTLIAGFDGRDSSPDIFAGVVSAAARNGCHVLDAGRTTAAAAQFVCRSHSAARAAVLVTGAGEPSSMTGFDFVDEAGNAVTVPWQEFDVSVRRPGDEAVHAAAGRLQDVGDLRLPERIRDSVNRLMRDGRVDEPGDLCPGGDQIATDESILRLPEISSSSAGRFRTTRSAGRVDRVNAEEDYRNWLRQWFPRQCSLRIPCICFGEMTAERLLWLTTKSALAADVVPGIDAESPDTQLRRRVLETQSTCGAVIGEDDRFLAIADRHGRVLTPWQLSDWVNSGRQGSTTHLTTHVPDDGDRVVMMDTAGPHSGAAHHVISDALALLGCVVRLIDAGTRPG